MKLITYCFILITGILGMTTSYAQKKKSNNQDKKEATRPVLLQPINYLRNSVHFGVDKAQSKIDMLDGKKDTFIVFFNNPKADEELSKIVFEHVDDRQINIENESTDNRIKIRDLTNLQEFVNSYYADLVEGELAASDVRKKENTYLGILKSFESSNPNKYVDDNMNLEIFKQRHLYEDSSDMMMKIMVWYSRTYPDKAVKLVSSSWDKRYLDTMITILAPTNTKKFLGYANQPGKASKAMKRNGSPTAKVLVTIAEQSSPQNVYKNYVFYDAIRSGKMTVKQADDITNNKAEYFQNLVQYRLDNEHLSNLNVVLRDIKTMALTNYVRVMNELHESNDNVRFKCISTLTPQQMYYVAISGDEEIYTSSFLGLYKRMMTAWGARPSDSLLVEAHYDKFRTFIRELAGYNVINDFLTKMEPDARDQVLTDFVSNLEESTRINGLGDAVDVADSYGSIKDSAIQMYVKKVVKSEYLRCRKIQDKQGMAIYSILMNVFDNEANLDSGKIVSELPPVLTMPFDQLKDANGKVVSVMFFYGDPDGIGNFNSYRNRFASPRFKTTTEKDWIKIESTNGKLVLYMNVPHPEPGDELAQNHLMKYLHDQNIHPTILVHRGHSYHVELSIDNMEASNKIVVLGSCGGYHNLKNILEHSEQAQIVSSKQTGVGVINNKILDALYFDYVDNGKDVEWIPLWNKVRKELQSTPAKYEYFEDYIPPYQNLGAIFVVSYYKLVGQLEEAEAEVIEN